MSKQPPTSVPASSQHIVKCPECSSKRLIKDYATAEVVCMDCGFVVDDRIADSGPEWRAFDMEQMAKRRRVGMPSTFTIHDKGLSTTIDWRNKDAYGKSLSSERRAQLYRLRKWQRRTRVLDYAERNLALALSNLSKICASINLPKIILETASVIYRKALKERLIRGRSIQGISAASVYMACRKCGIARTLDEVAYASGINRKKVGKCYRFMLKKLDETILPLSPSHYISRLVNHLELTGGAEIIALSILRTAKKQRLTSGRAPLGIASAATYISSILVNDYRTQREVAETANVTEVTIRNRYKELMEKLEIIVKL